jgi:hypothetical protein
MARARKMAIVSNVTEETIEPTINVSSAESIPATSFVLGDKIFEVRPISERDAEFAYQDNTDFTIEAIPVLLKFMSLQDSLEAAQSIAELNEYDLVRLAREFADTLPVMVSIVCKEQDREVTPELVKEWSKSPLNPNLIKAVVLQIKADNIMDQVREIQATLGELNAT